MNNLNEKIKGFSKYALGGVGFKDARQVDFNEFSQAFSTPGFLPGKEITRFEVDGMKFEQGYGTTAEGEKIYMTIFVQEYIGFHTPKENKSEEEGK